MHHTSRGIWEQIGAVEGEKTVWEASKIFGLTEAGTKVKKGKSLFPRIDVKKEIEELDNLGGKKEEKKSKKRRKEKQEV